MKSLFLGLGFLVGMPALANMANDPALPVGHCYHWLQSSAGYLDFKYDYAKSNQNELTFYTSPGTSNGAAAGPGLYCAKSPSGSYSYGDRVIRIEFVHDVVVLDASTDKKICGVDGKYYANDQECQSKDWDVKLYHWSPDWYVIQNPRAIKSWSATSQEVIRDMQRDSVGRGYDSHIQKAISLINEDINKNGRRNFVNGRARMKFLEVVTNMQMLRSMPALAVLGELRREEAKQLSEARLDLVMESTVSRVLQDSSLHWSDVKPVIDADKDLKDYFVAKVQKQVSEVRAGIPRLRNFEVILMVAVQGKFPQDQIQTLAAAMVKDPRALGKAFFAKKDLTPSLKKVFETEVQRRTLEPTVKSDQAQVTSLLLFALSNGLSAEIQAQTQTLFYNFVKTINKSTFFITDGLKDYPLGNNINSAMDLCQAHIQAYRLVDRELSFKNRNIQMEGGRINKLEDAAHFCLQKSGLLEVLSHVTSSEGGNAYVITGKFEDTAFRFVAVNIETLRPQVEDFVRKNSLDQGDGIDDITFSVNGAAVQALRNDNSYWKTASQITDALIAGVQTQGLLSRDDLAKKNQLVRMSIGKAHKIDVKAESETFSFGVNTVDDLDQQCELVKPRFDGRDIDDLSVSVDGGSVQSFHNDQSYWKSGNEICSIIHRAIAGKILSKASAAVMAKKSSARYSFEVVLESVSLTFAVNSFEEIYGQCKTLVDDAEVGDVDDLKVKLKGQKDRTFHNERSYWKLTSAICDMVNISVFGFVLSREQLSFLSLKRKYKVEVTFQGIPATFNVNDKSELKSQCLALLKPVPFKTDEILYSINGSSQQKLYSSSSYWNSPSENCEVLASNIRLP